MTGTEKNILMVEDEPIAQSVYQNRLKREGFEISFAEDWEVALNVLSTVRPDLVVLDLMLPKVNGADMLKQIRSEERLKETPVLVISNDYVTGLSQRAMEFGATRGMLKTECTAARLVETVRDMLGYESAFALSQNVSDDKQAEVFVAAAEAAMQDEMLLKETRGEFIKKAPADVAKIREACLAYVKAGETPEAKQELNNLYKQVRFFATHAGLSGCVRMALLSSAFEALLFETVFKPSKATPSVSKTFAQAVDCLDRLCQINDASVVETIPKAKVLAVDDDAVCNFAMVGALKRAHFEPVSVEDPLKALEMAGDTHYDIFLLDINMAGMDGFQLCEKLRGMPEYKETPVIFVTSNADYRNRAQSILSGGNDLIPKPIVPVELALKATIRLLHPQSQWPGKTSAAAEECLATRKKSSTDDMSRVTVQSFISPPLTEVAGNGVGDAKPVDMEMIQLVASQIKPLDSFDTQQLIKLPVPRNEEPKPAPREIKETKEESPKMEAVEVPEVFVAVTENVKPMEPPIPFQPALPAEPITTSNPEPELINLNMETKTKSTVDEVARGVAQIIFGDENLSDMNIRLTRIALERYNISNTQNFDEATRGIARIIFGDDKITDMNVRLTRIALERYNITQTNGQNGSSKPAEAPLPLT